MAKRLVNEEPVNVKWWHEETDVVVAGGSYAGLSAAVEASARGAKVILLEKGKDSLHPVGRDGRGFVGMFAAESRLQKQEGINLTRDEAFKYAVEHAHWRCNAPLVRKIIDRSAGLIDWLEKQGVTFRGVYRHQPHFPRNWHWFGDQSLEVIRVLTRRAEENQVKLMYQTRATDLIVNPEGRVIGIKAMAEGQVLRIRSRVAILATGGTPFFRPLPEGASPDRADGIAMAECAGAHIDYTEQYTFGFGVTKAIPPELNELRRVPEQPLLFVNKSGERVFDEGYTFQPEMQCVAEYQKDQTLIQIFDESSKTNLMNTGVKFLEHGTKFQKLTKLNEEIQEGLKRGLIEKALTIRELAGKIMVDPAILENTVNQYNQFCDKKHDDMFLKDPEYLEPVRKPPFYAIICDQQFFVGGRTRARRVGGVRINADCQSLGRNNNIIRGLYAAGKDAAGMYGDTYPIYLSGINMTFEIDTGRIAGENAATEVHQK